ncbi:HAD family hydrolase [Acholeplasma vituli]|uniref:HAD family hydrolase n=1 Tax=Paracholeplasma vituli TaxID=69473 RepID=A0ABT2PV83_9MOLU|nr:HAD family hydrolase [Paracholeplasma vituli]MCU0104628.1 HAD family hydrolase [Paracholeplasma vituli]
MKKVILFDLDGTLLDTLTDLTNAINHMLLNFNFKPRTAEEIRRFLGNGAKQLVELSIGKSVEPEKFEEYYQYYDTYYQAHSEEQTAPYEGIPQVLESLKKRGYRLAVISNKQDIVVKQLVDKMFPNTFDYALGVTEDGIKKPDPRMIDKVLEAMGIFAHEAYLIGDSETDIQTGKNSNLTVIACLWGFRDMKDIAPMNPEFIVGKPYDILKVI